MFFDQIRRIAAWAGLPAALALATPMGAASAATPSGTPTPLSIAPTLANTIPAGTGGVAEANLVEVAQRAGNPRRYPRSAATARSRSRTARNTNRYVNRGRPGPNQRYNNRRTRQVARSTARRTARRVDRRQWRRRAYYQGRWWTYNNGYYYDNAGVAVAAGVIGLALGALAGAAYANDDVVYDDGYYGGVPAPYTGEWYRQCGLKYRSFRSSDGTYLGYDGVRHTCRLP